MTCNAFFHIRTTSLRMNCAGMGGLTTEVTVSRMGYCIILHHIASNFVNAQQATPLRICFRYAGGVAFMILGFPQKWELSTFPTSYPQVTGSQLLGAGLGGGLAAVGV